ncbi:LuxR C-terminal-related transcriptional regulator [Spongiactinospora sp. TRM90649]|uniref:LuxR C-terminal-related transcriptional regulator n=1 Tax=Spongiactinospora sp. TRM90649 TaxID=3031114 RepID=UPI0023F95E12|nr:LuxR C-terminal-related transcriptional regulator [Spongiactinospora sp. TRM90649]MDF5756357.1 LuxR C-terminal-related transcriptional regulator [Spongiactinospora sp. TRM90649]
MGNPLIEPVRPLPPTLVAELVTSPSLERLLNRFLDEAPRRLASFAAGVYVHDHATGRPAAAEVRGLGNYYVRSYERHGRDRDPVVQIALRDRRVCDSDSLMPREEWLKLPVVHDVFAPHAMARVLCAPVVVGAEVVGTLNLARRDGDPEFTEEDRDAARAAATVLGIAVSSVRERAAAERERVQLAEALDRCDTPVILTDLGLARRHLNAPAAALFSRLGDARPEVERLLDCDDDEMSVVSWTTGGEQGSGLHLTITSQRLPSQPDVIVSVIATRDESSRAIAPARLALLTPREVEIAMRALTGRRDGEIAADLVISRHTVKHHLKSIYTKLGVHTRAELLDRLLF